MLVSWYLTRFHSAAVLDLMLMSEMSSQEHSSQSASALSGAASQGRRFNVHENHHG
jgi:hypothetical protein